MTIEERIKKIERSLSDTATREIIRVAKERDEARAMARKYGMHGLFCNGTYPDRACKCGWSTDAEIMDGWIND